MNRFTPRKSGFGLSVLIATALVLGLSATASADSTTVLATIGPKVITVGDLQFLIDARSMYRSSPAEDLRRLRALLDEEILNRLIALEARGIPLTDRRQFLARLRRALAGVALRLYGDDHVAPRIPMDSARIDSFYHAHIGRYSASEDARRIRHITAFHPGRGAPKGMSTYIDPLYEDWPPDVKMDSIWARLANGESFAQLARIHSEDPNTKGGGGEMGWLPKSELPKGPFGDHAWTQPLHLISRPFASPAGWHIIQVLADRPAGLAPMDISIARDIVQLLTDEDGKRIMHHLSDSLMTAGTIQIVEAALAVPDAQLREEMVFAVVNGRDTIFAADYLIDRAGWVQKFNQRPIDAAAKRDMVSAEYYKAVCWYSELRKLGYLDRPEVRKVYDEQTQAERQTILRLQMSTGRYAPDAGEIERYYQSHRSEFREPPQGTNETWRVISARLKSEHEQNTRRDWIERMGVRQGLTRHDDRLTELRLIQPG